MKKPGQNQEYKEYLKTDHWKKKREETFIKQGRKCRICGSEKELHIHHRSYRYKGESTLFKEINASLLVICKDCHFLWHELQGHKRIPFPRLRRVLSQGIDKRTAFTYPYSKAKTLLNRNQQPSTATASTG